jgi:hypothetical protein
MAKIIVLPCIECGKETTLQGKQLYMARNGKVYCSQECSDKRKARISSATMADTNRKYASERMTRKNPMKNPIAKEKMISAARVRGWPETSQRGGNGKSIPLPQQLLACALGWPTEVVIKTNARKLGFPPCYKVDIANETLKIAIEIDGKSHAMLVKQGQDQKKTSFLESLGWIVLRFSNAQIKTSLAQCVQTVLSTISKLKDSTPTPPMES